MSSLLLADQKWQLCDFRLGACLVVLHWNQPCDHKVCVFCPPLRQSHPGAPTALPGAARTSARPFCCGGGHSSGGHTAGDVPGTCQSGLHLPSSPHCLSLSVTYNIHKATERCRKAKLLTLLLISSNHSEGFSSHWPHADLLTGLSL